MIKIVFSFLSVYHPLSPGCQQQETSGRVSPLPLAGGGGGRGFTNNFRWRTGSGANYSYFRRFSVVATAADDGGGSPPTQYAVCCLPGANGALILWSAFQPTQIQDRSNR